jgi:hypothetical protein
MHVNPIFGARLTVIGGGHCNLLSMSDPNRSHVREGSEPKAAENDAVWRLGNKWGGAIPGINHIHSHTHTQQIVAA